MISWILKAHSGVYSLPHHFLFTVVLSAAVSRGQGWGTLLQVPRFGVVFRGTGHGQSEDAVGVTVTAAGVG